MLEEEIKILKGQIANLENRLSEIETIRDPQRANVRIDAMIAEQEAQHSLIEELSNKMNALVKDDKFIELFTDEELRTLYDNSGLNSKDVATIIHNNPTFKDQDVSAPAISKIINSIVKDVHLRSFLGRYFRYELIKKQKLNV